MFSINLPVPGSVAQIAGDLYPQLVAFDAQRDQHTLVVKRFNESTLDLASPDLQLAALKKQLPTVLAGTPAFEIVTDEIDYFAEPTRGTGPVVYLDVDSPGLQRLHESLTAEFGTIAELEGDDYVPHVTLARGGSISDAEQLAGEIEPLSWTVSELHLWDSRYRETITRYTLPA